LYLSVQNGRRRTTRVRFPLRYRWTGAVAVALSLLFSSGPLAADPSASVPAAGVKVASEQVALDTPVPTKWLPSKGRQCYRRGRYRNFCQGPRRAPLPRGPEAELARKLELGDIKAVSRIMLDPPPEEWVAAAGPDTEADSLQWPIPEGQLWRGFGRVRRGSKRRRWHKGIDIGAPEGTLIRASKGGLVIYADNGVRGYGNLMVVVHPDATVALYSHARALYLFPGQKVRRGQVLGEVGHTGIARGSHLHFEYRIYGRPRNPLHWFDLDSVPEQVRNRISPATQRRMTAKHRAETRQRITAVRKAMARRAAAAERRKAAERWAAKAARKRAGARKESKAPPKAASPGATHKPRKGTK
jgi:septal ring factor EnvC (AmiA/AmiB activator)